MHLSLFYLSHESFMSFVVLQLFPTLAPHKAGCISPLQNTTQVIKVLKVTHQTLSDPVIRWGQVQI